MADLSYRANNLSIGTGGITSFLGSLSHRACNNGLFTFTTAMNFRRANTVNNYQGGAFGRYDYSSYSDGDIDDTTRAVVSLLDGTMLGRSYTYRSFIGDGYTTNGAPMNSGLRFISTDEFTNFSSLLREVAVSRNYDENYNLDKYHDNSSKFVAENYENNTLDDGLGVSSYSTLPYTFLGDQFNVNAAYKLGVNHSTLIKYGERFREVAENNETLVKEGVGREEEYRTYSEIQPDVEHPFDNNLKNYFTQLPREKYYREFPGLESFALEELDKYYDLKSFDGENITNPYVKKMFDRSLPENFKNKNTFTEDLEFGDEYSTQSNIRNQLASIKYNFARNGLYEYYSKEREKYSSELENNLAKYPSGWIVYSYLKEYQRPGDKGEEFSNYSINDKKAPVINGTVSIGGDKFITKNKKSSLFSFLNEAENGNEITISESETADNSAIKISDDFNKASSGLLRKVNAMFKQEKIGTIVNRFHTSISGVTLKDSDVISAYDEKFGMSRGRNLLKKTTSDKTNGYENPYCRVWTAHHQYSKLKHRIRPFYNDSEAPMDIKDTQANYGGLRPNGGATHLNDYSVLRPNGYVRITPKEDMVSSPIKNYMFSLENLAWRDAPELNNLSPEQRGPNGGRIMWFPPYNLKFSENINAEWNGNKFIGRGEQIFTYVNTDRAGVLSFTLLIDHPSILNKWARAVKNDASDKTNRDLEILRYFAGCDDLSSQTTGEVKVPGLVYSTPKPKEDNVEPDPTPEGNKKIAYVVFFPNNYSGTDNKSVSKTIETLDGYEIVNGAKEIRPEDKDLANQDEKWKDENTSEYSLNISPSGDVVAKIRSELSLKDENMEIRFLAGDNGLVNIKNEFTGDKIFGQPASTVKISSIEVAGFASSHGWETEGRNPKLVERRRAFIKNALLYESKELKDEMFRNLRTGEACIIKMPDDVLKSERQINALEAKIARAAVAIFNIEWKEEIKPSDENTGQETGTAKTASGKTVTGSNELDKEKNEKKEETPAQETVVVEPIERPSDGLTFDNEFLYFQEIGNGNEDMVKKNIVDKVRYFNPAFHSITPEGFNARLTFLNQCTRQGPTHSTSQANTESSDYLKYAGNLSFGRPPYCILRIGDFFHTKICIDSISITYGAGGDVLWDLNQEGVGVQPMFADVNISFKFIGGQDIGGVVETLQNAVSSNFYANASVYDFTARRKEK